MNDALRLIELQDIAFESDFHKYGRCPAYHEPPEQMKANITADNKAAYVITVDGEDAGDIIIRKRDDDSYYIRVLSILPQFQNMKIGRKAIEFLYHTYRDCNAWELITPQDNLRNCHFYESCGFVKIGEEAEKELTLNIFRKQITL